MFDLEVGILGLDWIGYRICANILLGGNLVANWT